MVARNLLAGARTPHSTLTLRVQAKELVAEGVVRLILSHPAGSRLPDWTPGAHINLVLPNGATRQYSLCGDRWDPYTYRVAVLREPAGRGGSTYVHDSLAPGELVGIGGTHNYFPLVPADRYVFIAGGIGITPLIPMMHQAELMNIEWELLYGGRTRASMAFWQDLRNAYGGRVHISPQDECGLLDLPGCLAGAPTTGTKVYACGPAPLLNALREACAGRPAHSLRTERFVAAGQAEPVRRTPFDVELGRSGRTVTVTPDVSVLHAVRRAGAEVLSSCEQGTCGTCLVPVSEGTPDHRDAVLSEDERAAGDCMLPCVSRSRSARLVLDL
ncbi:PDR/VanB family oxidoreductase [Streptomyces sp. NPDC005791]|uniref:PDR/VanB family oxidoreductase n=1 Tax=unclassified Streptomyces TaxID=2593676 RepID=UPI0033E60887